MQCDALYLHIPFCRSRCPYCDFYSLPAEPGRMDAYTNALLRALAQNPFSLAPLDTVYFGGGTPSAFGGARIEVIMNSIRNLYSFGLHPEITVECNPCSTTPALLRQLRDAGVNRLSFGMQSGNDHLLARLGRAHTRAGLEQAVEMADAAGFSNLSLDLMLATPGQTIEQLRADIALCAQLGAAHLSAYLLKIEPGTPFARENVAALCPDEEQQADWYLEAVERLAQAGYRQYEISNFCRNNKISRHNYKYWDAVEYLGLGPSAHSFVDGRRFYFPSELAAFLAAPDPLSLAVQDGEGGGLKEYLMLRLRLSAGIVWQALTARYPRADAAPLREKARPLVRNGLVLVDQTGLRLTPRGMLLSNAVTGALLD